MIEKQSRSQELIRCAVMWTNSWQLFHNRAKLFQNPKSNNLKITKSIEPLSERELEVLRLLGTELSGPEIARELIVSLNTLRTHTKNIFNKLGVNNRRAAVHRAEELNLF